MVHLELNIMPSGTQNQQSSNYIDSDTSKSIICLSLLPTFYNHQCCCHQITVVVFQLTVSIVIVISIYVHDVISQHFQLTCCYPSTCGQLNDSPHLPTVWIKCHLQVLCNVMLNSGVTCIIMLK